ncbi:zinc finger protein 677-like [Culicoides brevitarsis]|uniref:zinc finger protein 677-like n=1 Tax=Culicoides brevitarsis TaxID=469753 RepID=UPI00307BF6E7
MELYHDEYSVFYEYDDEDSKDRRNGQKTLENDEIPVSEVNDGEMPVQETADSDFDEDYDDDEGNEEHFTNSCDDEDLDENSQMTGGHNSSNCETLENVDGTYRCPLCPKEVVSKYNLKRHMMIHTGEKPHKCDTCYKGFREQSDLRKHMKVHVYGNRLFECNICFRSYLSYKSVKCYYCEGDDEDAPPPNTYEEDPTKLYNCFLCSATQLSTTQLKQHLVQIHPATSRVTFGNGSSQNGTVSNTNGAAKSSITSSTLSKNATKSADDMEKIHKCNVCSKAFRSKQFLMLHTLTHANNRIESAF